MILPGLNSPCGSKCCLIARNASLIAGPNCHWIHSPRQSPSPCSPLKAPRYLRTSSLASSAIDRAADLPTDARPIKAELAAYRALAAAGGWPRITGDLQRTLEPGATDAARVPQLRARLGATDPLLAAQDRTSPLYDVPLQEAVRRFQEHEALEADGRIGPISQAAYARFQASRGQVADGFITLQSYEDLRAASR